MAADVSSLVRLMNGYSDEANGTKSDLVTRDLLGGCAVTRSPKEIDLDLRIPSGWERRLDLLSGEMYLKKSNPDADPNHNPIHDLNLPPPVSSGSSSAVDLKLLLSTSAYPPPSDCQCTLEKVKSALERAGRGSSFRNQRSDGSPSPSSSTTSSSAARRRATADHGGEEAMDGSDSSGNLMAAGCSKCLMYVLISGRNPRCPRCDCHVALQSPVRKRPRIEPIEPASMLDLNLNCS